MERLKYVGEFGPKRVSVPGCGEVERGGTLDVPNEVADRLLDRQPTEWTKVAPENDTGDTAPSENDTGGTASDKGE